MRITINDVAKKAEVSKATISRYLNGQYKSMSAETRRRITEAINELNYKPNLVARSLKRKSSQTIGVIVANILNPFSTEITRGIEDVCITKNFNIILCNADDSPKKQQEYLEMLHLKQVDGFIIQPAKGEVDGLHNIYKTNVPFVLIDRKIPDLSVDTVTVNNYIGTKNAIKYLIELGHQNIAFISADIEGVSSRQDRFQGFVDALSEAGFRFKDEYLKIIQKNSSAVNMAIRQLFSLASPPTAIFSVNGRITLDILLALKELKFRIPNDVSLLSFDSPEWAEVVEPPLTSVVQPVYKIGVTAAELLLKRILSKRKGGIRPKEESLETELVIRESCRKIL